MSYSSIDTPAKNPVSKAFLFNDFFSFVFSTRSSDFSSRQIGVVNLNLLIDVSTSHSEVRDILWKLEVNKATGVDGIPARILKECAQELSYPLALLFNMSLKSGRVSSSWKRANFTPVFKAGTRDVVKNYRSISLLSVPSKCQEKIVDDAIYSHVAPFLTDWQHSFVKGRSCATQLVLTHHQ